MNPFVDQDDPTIVAAAQGGDRAALTTLRKLDRPEQGRGVPELRNVGKEASNLDLGIDPDLQSPEELHHKALADQGRGIGLLGLDGAHALVLLLSALLAPLVVLASWQHTDRPRTYFALLSLLFTGLFGTFTALNFFHWFLYWELALVPPFFLIKLFGKGEERHSAALNFFLFTVLGSVAMLLGFLFLYRQTGTFDFIELAEKRVNVSPLIFCAILAGLWVKVPLAPLHIWQAPAYAAAPPRAIPPRRGGPRLRKAWRPH